jgi:hypothetical protein
MVDALRPGVGDEDACNPVVGYFSQKLVDASPLPGPAGDEEVGAGTKFRVGIVLRVPCGSAGHRSLFWALPSPYLMGFLA